MIPITEYAGRDVAVYGLGRTGLSAAKALKAGGARVHAWDDNEETRAKAEAAGIALSDINKRDWQTFAALVLSPGIPYQRLAEALPPGFPQASAPSADELWNQLQKALKDGDLLLIKGSNASGMGRLADRLRQWSAAAGLGKMDGGPEGPARVS